MAVLEYKKGADVKLSEHFSTADFDCHCTRPECAVTLVDEDLPGCLEQLWALAGPFKIDSGFRCLAHNAEVGGKDDSRHLRTDAADCKSLKGYNGNLMARYAEQVPDFAKGGIGIYPTFAHCDRRGWAARWGQEMKC